MSNENSIAAYWSGRDGRSRPAPIGRDRLRARLGAQEVSLGLVFMSPKFFPHAQQVLEILRVHAQIPLLAGCSSSGSCRRFAERLKMRPALVLALYSLPGAKLKGFRFTQEQVEEADGENYWPIGNRRRAEAARMAGSHSLTRFTWTRKAGCARGMKVMRRCRFMADWPAEIFPNRDANLSRTAKFLRTAAWRFPIGGDVKLTGVISQGCTPIGETWTLTRVEQNLIHHIAQPPRLRGAGRDGAKTFARRPAEGARQSFHRPRRERIPRGFSSRRFSRAQFDRRRSEFRRAGGGALPRAGQTIQFHRRDAAAATEDMDELLDRAKEKSGGATIYGGCLSAATGAEKIFLAARATTPSWCRRNSARSDSPDFSATAKSAPSAKKIFCTASPPPSRCS